MLDDSVLERSSVVANNAMNRERGLDGVNSYRPRVDSVYVVRAKGRPDRGGGGNARIGLWEPPRSSSTGQRRAASA